MMASLTLGLGLSLPQGKLADKMDEYSPPKRSLIQRISGNLSDGLYSGSFYLLLVAGFILFLQSFIYLKTGAWPQWALFDLISSELPAPFIQWLFTPQDWLGLNHIVTAILIKTPIALDVIGLALFSFWASMKFGND